MNQQMVELRQCAIEWRKACIDDAASVYRSKTGTKHWKHMFEPTSLQKLVGQIIAVVAKFNSNVLAYYVISLSKLKQV